MEKVRQNSINKKTKWTSTIEKLKIIPHPRVVIMIIVSFFGWQKFSVSKDDLVSRKKK